MSPLTNGWQVFVLQWRLLAYVFIFILASYIFLRAAFKDNLSVSECLSLALSGWLLPASILSLLWMCMGTQTITWLGIIFVIIFSLSLSRLKTDLRLVSSLTAYLFALAVFASLLLRLAFVSKSLLPSYFDSAFHFSLIQDITLHTATWTFQWLIANRYHINFHLLAAFLSLVSHTGIAQTMLVLGQVFLAFFPFSIFLPIKRITHSNMAGWFAVILASFGWYMPAHVVDWGKYPALMSLSLTLFVIGVMFLPAHRLNAKKHWLLYGLLGMGVLLAVLTHSRSLIVLGIAFLAWGVATWAQRYAKLLWPVTLVFIIALVILVQRQTILTPLFDPYFNNGVWVSLLVLVVSIFALKPYPQFIITGLLSIGLFLLCLFIPVTGLLPGREYLTLLDRPFVEMILFLPLSLMGGLGLAGLERKIQGVRLGRYVGWLAIGVITVNAFFTYTLYPSNCCVIVGKDDVVALDWMMNQLPVKARIGISSTEVKVNVSDFYEGSAGSDAGVWVTPLTGRETFSLPNHLNFEQESTLVLLCQNKITYLFVGELGQAFDLMQLESRPAWYRPLLSMPRTRVYEVVGCE